MQEGKCATMKRQKRYRNSAKISRYWRRSNVPAALHKRGKWGRRVAGYLRAFPVLHNRFNKRRYWAELACIRRHLTESTTYKTKTWNQQQPRTENGLRLRKGTKRGETVNKKAFQTSFLEDIPLWWARTGRRHMRTRRISPLAPRAS